ncbi:MAG: serine/threonine protein kinase, partial [Myxococcales bacterium]|nr:serine/threonine protein kinase [Myxococcales bacterium]
MPTLVPGQLVEKYRVVRLIASGGFGAVYEVLREDIRQRGALKVLTLSAEPAMVQRFINEARAAGAIRHPNIPQVYDLGMFPDGVPWLVMEYLEGLSLEAHLVAHRRLTLADVLEIFEDAAGAVAAAHAVKDPGPIIHRDLKPSNVMLLPSPKRGCGFRAMVLDFGIAKLAGDNLTKSGTILGT